MPENLWKSAALDLLTEVSILAQLVTERIEQQQPNGLNECRLGVLMVLGRQPNGAMNRAALVWMMEDTRADFDGELLALTGSGMIAEQSGKDGPMLHITDHGNAMMADAIERMMPLFKPALDTVPTEAMQQAQETLREIRRTLDHLPPD